MVVDRQRRDRLIKVVELYLRGELTAFEFDEEMYDKILDGCKDKTILHACREMWCSYDDCIDHRVHLNKEAWDLHQRLLMLLRTDAVLDEQRGKVWSGTEGVAVGSLVLFVGLMWVEPSEFWVCWFLMGVAAWLCMAGRQRANKPLSKQEMALYPFVSFAQLMSIGRGAVGFRKSRYPDEVRKAASEPLRSPVRLFIIQAVLHMTVVVFAPLVLIGLMLPSDFEKRVVRG